MARQAWFRGEGGSIILMDLPLGDVYAAQERQGRLTRVNADGSLWSDEPSHVQTDDERDAEDQDRPIGPVKPSRADSKALWQDYAKLSSDVDHDEIESMTKAQLVERFG